MSADEQKRAVGDAAAALVQDGMTVGLGTGSTAACFIRSLALRCSEHGLRIKGVPTSEQTADLARLMRIPLAELDEVRGIDLTVDGADEIGPGLALIKGGGGALLREKLVWEASHRCVVIADDAKRVPTLGAFPLPVEVAAFGHASTQARLCDVLADFDVGVAPRLRMKDGVALRTDGGNVIYDAHCVRIPDPARLAAAIKSITGVVDHGLFLDLADQALLGTEQGVELISP
jgi:ribose 5-phosphate isomerase A